MESLITNTYGKTRRAMLNGREHIVAHATLIVPGVLNGSDGPLYYPPNEIKKNHSAWDDTPIVVYHPTKGGRNVSYNDFKSDADRTTSGAQSIGKIRYSNISKNGKLQAEAWFDVEHTRQRDPRVLRNLEANRPIELSTGLHTVKLNAPNGSTDSKGRTYTKIATNYKPDHLAVLPDQKGACSLDDGCGILINQRYGKSTATKAQPSKTLSRQWMPIPPTIKPSISFTTNCGCDTSCKKCTTTNDDEDEQEQDEETTANELVTNQSSRWKSVENCGGIGSGRPGPCPGDDGMRQSVDERGGGYPGDPTPQSTVKQLVEHFTSGSFEYGDANKFRDAWRDMSDDDRKAVHGDLKKRGLLNPVDARKKKPETMTASDVIASVKGAYKIAKEKHESVPTNRHIPFSESDTHKKITGNNSTTNEADLSYEDIQQRVWVAFREAHPIKYNPDNGMREATCYIVAIFPEYVIYSESGSHGYGYPMPAMEAGPSPMKLYRQSYTMEDNVVSFEDSEPEAVQQEVSYVPTDNLDWQPIETTNSKKKVGSLLIAVG